MSIQAIFSQNQAVSQFEDLADGMQSVARVLKRGVEQSRQQAIFFWKFNHENDTHRDMQVYKLKLMRLSLAVSWIQQTYRWILWARTFSAVTSSLLINLYVH